MNVKKLLEIASVIEGRRIPYDVAELNEYWSNSQNLFYKLHEMDLVHLLRAFSNTLDELQLERERPPEYYEGKQQMAHITNDNEFFEVNYVGYKLKMSAYGIQFSDEDADKLTMEQLERHDFEQGDKFILYTDTNGLLTLKKERK